MIKIASVIFLLLLNHIETATAAGSCIATDEKGITGFKAMVDDICRTPKTQINSLKGKTYRIKYTGNQTFDGIELTPRDAFSYSLSSSIPNTVIVIITNPEKLILNRGPLSDFVSIHLDPLLRDNLNSNSKLKITGTNSCIFKIQFYNEEDVVPLTENAFYKASIEWYGLDPKTNLLEVVDLRTKQLTDEGFVIQRVLNRNDDVQLRAVFTDKSTGQEIAKSEYVELPKCHRFKDNSNTVAIVKSAGECIQLVSFGKIDSNTTDVFSTATSYEYANRCNRPVYCSGHSSIWITNSRYYNEVQDRQYFSFAVQPNAKASWSAQFQVSKQKCSKNEIALNTFAVPQNSTYANYYLHNDTFACKFID